MQADTSELTNSSGSEPIIEQLESLRMLYASGSRLEWDTWTEIIPKFIDAKDLKIIEGLLQLLRDFKIELPLSAWENVLQFINSNDPQWIKDSLSLLSKFVSSLDSDVWTGIISVLGDSKNLEIIDGLLKLLCDFDIKFSPDTWEMYAFKSLDSKDPELLNGWIGLLRRFGSRLDPNVWKAISDKQWDPEDAQLIEELSKLLVEYRLTSLPDALKIHATESGQENTLHHQQIEHLSSAIAGVKYATRLNNGLTTGLVQNRAGELLSATVITNNNTKAFGIYNFNNIISRLFTVSPPSGLETAAIPDSVSSSLSESDLTKDALPELVKHICLLIDSKDPESIEKVLTLKYTPEYTSKFDTASWDMIISSIIDSKNSRLINELPELSNKFGSKFSETAMKAIIFKLLDSKDPRLIDKSLQILRNYRSFFSLEVYEAVIVKLIILKNVVLINKSMDLIQNYFSQRSVLDKWKGSLFRLISSTDPELINASIKILSINAWIWILNQFGSELPSDSWGAIIPAFINSDNAVPKVGLLELLNKFCPKIDSNAWKNIVNALINTKNTKMLETFLLPKIASTKNILMLLLLCKQYDAVLEFVRTLSSTEEGRQLLCSAVFQRDAKNGSVYEMLCKGGSDNEPCVQIKNIIDEIQAPVARHNITEGGQRP